MIYRGIFWITNIDDPSEGLITAKIPLGEDDAVDGPVVPLNSKNHDNYNHALTLEEVRGGCRKAYDHYPRGRVEIQRSKVTIYASPHICTEEVLAVIIEEFGLTDDRILNIRMIPDHSEHYKCYLDRE